MDLPLNWYATPEGRNRYLPVIREQQEARRKERERARQLFDQALKSLPEDDADLVRRVFTGI